jgi:hypothetical protein
MSGEILLRFLTIGIIDVGGDDAKLEKLRMTAQDLVVALEKTPFKTSAFTLVAADPNVPANDPTVEEAVTALQKRWTTMANTFSATPVAVIRAILLEALVQAARQEDAIAVAFVDSARNALPYVESGNERAIWTDTVAEIEAKIDRRAETEWATPDSIAVQPLAFKSPEIGLAKLAPMTVKRDVLTTKIAAASGPIGENSNPYWPHNQPQNWANEFSRRLAVVMSETIEGAVANTKMGAIDVATPLNAIAKAISQHVDNTLVAVSGATSGLQRRTNLLWWKEALYSPSARVSYRDLPIFSAAALMALDLHSQVPIFSPASVSAFLNEAVRLLSKGTDDEGIPILTLIEEARAKSEMAPFREAAALLTAVPAGRGPVLGIIGHTPHPAVLDEPTFVRLAGVNASVVLTAPEWATWLFRELNAARATKASGAKRSRRKG